MRILAGEDKSDSGGSIKFLKEVRIAFLKQDFDYDKEKSIYEQIIEGQDFDYELRAKKILDEFSLSPQQKMSELSGEK